MQINRPIDLAIFNGNTASAKPAVIIEAKSPTNAAEMFSAEHPNVKSLQEPVYYFMLEYVHSGNHKIKWLAIVMVAIDLVSIIGQNAAGHIAHLGGALTGVAWAVAMRYGHDLTAGPNRLLDWLVSLFKRLKHREPRMGEPIKGGVKDGVKGGAYHYQPDVSDRESPSPADAESRLDEILGKLKQSGYDALSDEEKEFLFSASRKR